jgi:hypothetical protein
MRTGGKEYCQLVGAFKRVFGATVLRHGYVFSASNHGPALPAKGTESIPLFGDFGILKSDRHDGVLSGLLAQLRRELRSCYGRPQSDQPR